MTCEICRVRPAIHRHHALYRRAKRYPELDSEENIMIVCEQCHLYDGTADSYENKVKFWHQQCERYGHDHMISWHQSLRQKVKEEAYK